MIRAFLFDFNQTLIHCPAWMELEVRTFPRAALLALADRDLISVPTKDRLKQADRLFRARRAAANRSGRESTHHHDLQAILRALGLLDAVTQSESAQAIEELHRACLPDARLMPGADGALPALHAAGFRLGIVSNAAFSGFLHWSLQAFELTGTFDQVVISADVGLRKPRREIFELALEWMGVSAGEAVMVGDDFGKDIRAAKQAGLRTIWITPDPEREDPAQTAYADGTFASLAPIPDWASARS